MNLKTLFLATGILMSFTTTAQVKADLYTNLNAYNTNVFSTVDGIEITRRTNGDIGMSGGNDYKITAADKDLKKDLKKEYWGVKCNDTLYLNTKLLMKSKWYTKVLFASSAYMYFRAGIGEVYDPGKDSRIMTSVMLGPIGGAFAGAAAAKERYDYLLDLNTERVYVLDKKLLSGLLKNKPELQKEINMAKKPFTNTEIIGYLKQLPTVNQK